MGLKDWADRHRRWKKKRAISQSLKASAGYYEEHRRKVPTDKVKRISFEEAAEELRRETQKDWPAVRLPIKVAGPEARGDSSLPTAGAEGGPHPTFSSTVDSSQQSCDNKQMHNRGDVTVWLTYDRYGAPLSAHRHEREAQLEAHRTSRTVRMLHGIADERPRWLPCPMCKGISDTKPCKFCHGDLVVPRWEAQYEWRKSHGQGYVTWKQKTGTE